MENVEFIGRFFSFSSHLQCLGFCSKNPLGFLQFRIRKQVEHWIRSIMRLNNYYNE